jgi:hypothetical protein
VFIHDNFVHTLYGGAIVAEIDAVFSKWCSSPMTALQQSLANHRVMLHKYLSETYTKHRFHMMLDDGKKKKRAGCGVPRSDSEKTTSQQVVVMQSSD